MYVEKTRDLYRENCKKKKNTDESNQRWHKETGEM